MKKTMEVQDSNHSLIFLVLIISLNNNNFEFEIYRKTTHTGTVLCNESNHPIQQESSLPNEERFQKELNIFCLSNDYKKDIQTFE